MKAILLGDFAATVTPIILAKVNALIETDILADVGDTARLTLAIPGIIASAPVVTSASADRRVVEPTILSRGKRATSRHY